MHLANFKSDPSALLCANTAGGAPPQPAQPLAYLRRCIVDAAVAGAAILLCFRLLTSVTTDYS